MCRKIIFGEDVSGLTVEETAKKLADDFQKIPVTFQENGETDYQTTLGDLGYSIDETQLKKVRLSQAERERQEKARDFRKKTVTSRSRRILP